MIVANKVHQVCVDQETAVRFQQVSETVDKWEYSCKFVRVFMEQYLAALQEQQDAKQKTSLAVESFELCIKKIQENSTYGLTELINAVAEADRDKVLERLAPTLGYREQSFFNSMVSAIIHGTTPSQP